MNNWKKHISETVICTTVVNKINKITFGKGNSENLEKKIDTSKSLAKMLTENRHFFLKKFFFMFFLKIGQEENVFKKLEENSGKLHFQALITLLVTQWVKYGILEG